MTSMTALDAGPSKARRREFVTAMEAQRLLFDRVLADPTATDGHRRIAMAVARLVTSWSRLDDAVSRTQIAKTAGVSEATVKRTLKLWHDRGWIVWEPSKTRGKVSRLTVDHGSFEATRVLAHEGAGPRVIPAGSNSETRVTHDDPSPGSTRSGKNPGGTHARSDDPAAPTEGELLEQDAAQLLGIAAGRLGLSWEEWFCQPVVARRRAEATVEALLPLHGFGPVLDALTRQPAPPNVRTWSGLLRSRAEQMRAPHHQRASA